MAIVITSYGNIENAIEALRAGARDFLRKPFEPDDLLRAVGEALAARRREQERLFLRARLPLLEISQALMAEGDIEALAGQLLDVAVEQLGAEAAAILMLDQETDELAVVASAGPPEGKAAKMQVPAGEGIARQALLGRAPLVLETAAPANLDLLWPVLNAGPGTAAVCVPLHTGDKAIGLLTLSRVERTRNTPFSRSDLDLLSIMGGQIATALENAGLYEALERELGERVQAEQALRESESLLRSVADTSPDYILTLDEALRIQFANYASPGLTVEELIGTPLNSLAAEEQRAGVKATLEGVMSTGEAATTRLPSSHQKEAPSSTSPVAPLRLPDSKRSLALLSLHATSPSASVRSRRCGKARPNSPRHFDQVPRESLFPD